MESLKSKSIMDSAMREWWAAVKDRLGEAPIMIEWSTPIPDVPIEYIMDMAKCPKESVEIKLEPPIAK